MVWRNATAGLRRTFQQEFLDTGLRGAALRAADLLDDVQMERVAGPLGVAVAGFTTAGPGREAAVRVRLVVALVGVRPDTPAGTAAGFPAQRPLGAVQFSGLRVGGEPFAVRTAGWASA